MTYSNESNLNSKIIYAISRFLNLKHLIEANLTMSLLALVSFYVLAVRQKEEAIVLPFVLKPNASFVLAPMRYGNIKNGR